MFKRQTRNGTRRKEKRFEGVIPNLERRHVETDSDRAREHIEDYMASRRARPVKGRVSKRSRGQCSSTAPRSRKSTRCASATRSNISRGWSRTRREGAHHRRGDSEGNSCPSRLHDEVGLDYLTLDREASTLSGGESQRIRLATRSGAASSVSLRPRRALYRPPPAGQRPPAEHPRRASRPRDTLLVVEHDTETCAGPTR